MLSQSHSRILHCHTAESYAVTQPNLMQPKAESYLLSSTVSPAPGVCRDTPSAGGVVVLPIVAQAYLGEGVTPGVVGAIRMESARSVKVLSTMVLLIRSKSKI